MRGSKNRKLLELGLDRLSTYGLLRNRGRTEILSMAAQLDVDGYLRTDQEYQAVCLTTKASEVLYHGKKVQILVRKEVEEVPARSTAVIKLSYEDTDLYDALRELRARLAKEANLPAYVVFSNATLQDIARKKPRNLTEFKHVSGVGELKASW